MSDGQEMFVERIEFTGNALGGVDTKTYLIDKDGNEFVATSNPKFKQTLTWYNPENYENWRTSQ